MNLIAYKYMTSISKNAYNDIVNKYDNPYHGTINWKPVDVKSNIYIEIKGEDPKFKISDVIRISKHENIFGKGYVPNWSEKFFVVKKVKHTVSWAYVISDFKGEEIVETFYKKELEKANKKEFSVENVIKRKGHKLHVKWEDYDNSFNRWIDKKEYFTEMKSSGETVKVDLDLPNHIKKQI